MNIYHKINCVRKQITLLEEQLEKETQRYLNKFDAKKYLEMPFKPGNMIEAENNLMKLSGTIRELQRDLNRLVYQEGKQEVIDWYKQTQVSK